MQKQEDPTRKLSRGRGLLTRNLQSAELVVRRCGVEHSESPWCNPRIRMVHSCAVLRMDKYYRSLLQTMLNIDLARGEIPRRPLCYTGSIPVRPKRAVAEGTPMLKSSLI